MKPVHHALSYGFSVVVIKPGNNKILPLKYIKKYKGPKRLLLM
jgi:hypothetical protein